LLRLGEVWVAKRNQRLSKFHSENDGKSPEKAMFPNKVRGMQLRCIAVLKITSEVTAVQ
jgi:cytoplasmic iron level regulating protein YaaA (DUF328/UPF0246 family)